MEEKEGEATSSKATENSKNNSKNSNSKTKTIPKKVLLEEIIKKIDYFSSKNAVNDLDLYYLIKEFFAQFLELKYEFSLDELLSELDKVYMDAALRVEAIQFIEKVKIIEYADSSFSPEYLKELIRQLSVIARKLARISEEEKKGFWKKFGEFFIKDERAHPQTQRISSDINKIQETKTSSLENVADFEYPSTSNLESDNLNNLKKYEIEPKVDVEIKTVASENKEPETTKKNYSTTKNISKNYAKNEKKTDDKKDKITENSNVDWSSDVNASAKDDKENKTKKSNTDSDFKLMLIKAKSANKKTELIEIYKKIHDMYDAGSVDFQAKYYKDIMTIFNKLSKMK